MSRPAPEVPGFVTVNGAGKVLHLAARSVRDLIYTGRLPSVRLGRLHFVSTADLERERRRRLGLALPRPRPRTAPTRDRTPGRQARLPADPAARDRRAAERLAVLQGWLRAGHRVEEPRLPFRPAAAPNAVRCANCGARVDAGRFVLMSATVSDAADRALCAACGRRALLAWADERRHEAAAARQLADQLGGRGQTPAPDAATQLTAA
jgi:hypothetical protein